jgi:hypothetical protein
MQAITKTFTPEGHCTVDHIRGQQKHILPSVQPLRDLLTQNHIELLLGTAANPVKEPSSA